MKYRTMRYWLMRVIWYWCLAHKRRGAGRRGRYRYDDPLVSIEAILGFDLEEPSSPEREHVAEKVLDLITGMAPAHREELEYVTVGGDFEHRVRQLEFASER
jgi:DNA-directed RNA polymerase specialized sigma24 family protein